MPETNQNDIIEVEVKDEKLDAPNKDQKPKRPINEYSRQIHFWHMMTSMFVRYGPTLFLLGALSGLTFSILTSQTGYQGFHFVCMIIGWSLCAAGLLAMVFGLISRAMLKHYMSLDPNFTKE